jgi:hypothetical protein
MGHSVEFQLGLKKKMLESGPMAQICHSNYLVVRDENLSLRPLEAKS